jgi:hypothetical protein
MSVVSDENIIIIMSLTKSLLPEELGVHAALLLSLQLAYLALCRSSSPACSQMGAPRTLWSPTHKQREVIQIRSTVRQSDSWPSAVLRIKSSYVNKIHLCRRAWWTAEADLLASEER